MLNSFYLRLSHQERRLNMKGSCLCGEIQYEVKELASPIQHCSCNTCRKAHSAAFNTAAGVNVEYFRWLKGEKLLSQYSSSPGKVRYFCSQCGSQLVKIKEGSETLVLRVATLDDDPGSVPKFRIWSSHEVPWLDYLSPIPRYEKWEPSK